MFKSIKHEPCSISQSPNSLHTHNSNMSLAINTLIKLIPTFDTSKTQEVYRFVRSCDSVFQLAIDVEKQQILLIYAFHNITGVGALDIHCRRYAFWDDLKS